MCQGLDCRMHLVCIFGGYIWLYMQHSSLWRFVWLLQDNGRVKVSWHTSRRNWHALSSFCRMQVHKAWICFAWELPTPGITTASFVETAI